MEDKKELILGGGIGMWILSSAIAWLYFGTVALINPFTWVLSLMEAIEILVWFASGPDLGLIADQFWSAEFGNVLMGWSGFLAWVTSIVAISRISREVDFNRRWPYLLGVSLFTPLLALITLLVFLSKVRGPTRNASAGSPSDIDASELEPDD